MTGEPSTFSLIANYLLLALFGGSAVLAFWDTRRRGRALSESIAWALFMAFMFPLAIVVYIYFRKKKLL
ncbi:MAG TPA: hypothetical protein DCZ10_17715 [Pelotomaculum sp.]|nr:hypothetical protein [Pelotomaculum sp.]